MGRPAGIKVGDVFTTTKHGDVTVVEYCNNKKIRVSFLNKEPPEYKWVIASSLRSGYIAPDSSYYKVGDILEIKEGTSVKIVEFTNYDCIKVVVCGREDMHPINTSIGNLLLGSFKDTTEPLVCGVGYLGQGRFLTKDDKNINTHAYNCWSNMIHRCYNVKDKNYKAYGGRGVTVCKKWHNFQNFASWYSEQNNNSEFGWQIDKDLTKIGNKLYSEDFCSIVPAAINCLLLTKRSKEKELPIGIYYEDNCGKFRSKSPKEAKLIRGTFISLEDAVNNYLVHKSQKIKHALDLYHKDLPPIVMENIKSIDLRYFVVNRELKITGFNTVSEILGRYYRGLKEDK